MASNKSLNRQRGYTVDFKVMVVNWLRAHEQNISLTSREFGVDRKRVREWDQKYDYLQQHNKGTSAKKQRLGGGRCSMSKELDDKVFEFLEEERSNGFAVSNRLLLRQASEIAGGLGLQDFKGSTGWLQRWKRRYNVGYRRGTNVSQKVPADYADQIFKVRKDIILLRKQHSIEPSHIYNMDQTMCRFDMPQNRTVDVRGGRTIRIKTTHAEKKGFTVALAASASGEKLPAVIIFKEKNGVLGPRITKKLIIPSNVQVNLCVGTWLLLNSV